MGEFLVEIILCAGGGGATFFAVLFTKRGARVGPDGAGLLEGGLEAVEGRFSHGGMEGEGGLEREE